MAMAAVGRFKGAATFRLRKANTGDGNGGGRALQGSRNLSVAEGCISGKSMHA